MKTLIFILSLLGTSAFAADALNCGDSGVAQTRADGTSFCLAKDYVAFIGGSISEKDADITACAPFDKANGLAAHLNATLVNLACVRAATEKKVSLSEAGCKMEDLKAKTAKLHFVPVITKQGSAACLRSDDVFDIFQAISAAN